MLVVLQKLCETSRWFSWKFTQLSQILHDRRLWQSRQISTLLIYQTNKGVMFGDTFSYFSLFAFFIQNRYRGQVRGFFFLCQWFWLFASWDLFLRPGSPRSPKMPLARKWRRSLQSTLSTWPGGIRELKEWLHSFFFFLFFSSTYPTWGVSEGEIYYFLST